MGAATERHFQRYDLLRRIATGGMAEVYLAKAHGVHGFEKKLAIKRILPELAADREFEEHFIAEAKLAASLDHAHIVYVHDFGRLAGSLFIAMEHVDGLDLAELLRRYREHGRKLPLAAAFHIAIAIAAGLDHAHGKGVIHRDVSPSNILLSHAGEVRIADFGIAMAVRQNPEEPSSRRRIMGKWRYMSPEQTRGERLDTSSDVFSMGSVMYELFVSEKLFPGEQPEEIIANIHHLELPRASERRSGLPQKLDHILQRALERDPRARYGRAVDMQRALTELSYESSIVATAMEVADAVQAVSIHRGDRGQGSSNEHLAAEPPGSAKLSVDEIIRVNLGESKPRTERRTAVDELEPAAPAEQHPTSMVRTGVGRDGLTHWSIGRSTAARASTLRRYLLAALALALAAAGGIMALRSACSSAGPSNRMRPDAAAADAGMADAGITDAAPPDAATMGELAIMSTPPGAAIRLDGVELGARTPHTITVSPAAPHRIELAMSGYLSYRSNDIIVATGAHRTVDAVLTEAASLALSTAPSEARVSASGEPLGTTPLTLSGLPPGKLKLVISKSGYHPVHRTIVLHSGQLTRITETLREIRYGYIDVHIEGSWADIFENKRRLGRAPVRGLKLPEGTHRLRFRNPASGRERVYSVEVVAEVSKYYSFTLDP